MALIIGSLIIHPLAFCAVIYLLMLAGVVEFFQLVGNKDVYPQRIIGLISSSILFFLTSFVALEILPAIYLAFLPLLIILFFVAEFFREKPKVLQNLAFSIFPLIYIAVPLSMLVFLVSPAMSGVQRHWHLAFSFFIILWSNDTFAYLSGMLLGKHKLFEKISPKKTWEGSIGGTLFGLLAAYILSHFFLELSLGQWLAGALIITITGTLGDLSESLLKRNFKVKDSGTFFPGHGGVLDRFDSVLFAAPAFFCYLILLQL